MNSVPANGTMTLSSLDAQGRGSETELAKSSMNDVDQTLGAASLAVLCSSKRLKNGENAGRKVYFHGWNEARRIVHGCFGRKM